jgi:hypothetical protein
LKQFEYETIVPDDILHLSETIQELGDQGWELVCEYRGAVIFKREIIKTNNDER